MPAALVDLAGTLCDSAPELAAAVDRVRGELGYPRVGVTRVREQVGEGVDALMGRALCAASSEDRYPVIIFRQPIVGIFWTELASW